MWRLFILDRRYVENINASIHTTERPNGITVITGTAVRLVEWGIRMYGYPKPAISVKVSKEKSRMCTRKFPYHAIQFL